MKITENLYFDLLKIWCDSILKYQIKGLGDTRLDGGILCPSCMRIHGRSGDAVLPLVAVYKKTGIKDYVIAAEKLFDWSENMLRPDGSYNNDQDSTWNGITIFAQISFGECLLYDSEVLPEGFHGKLRRRFQSVSEYIYDHLYEFGGNVNYPVTSAYAMALASVLLKDESRDYASAAGERAEYACGYITEDGLLYGEGRPWDEITAKGCRPIDIGYNVEESLQSLALYAELMSDDEVMQKVLFCAGKHIEFMLPDGAWDNSFGSRSFKWTYWGGRTSDGCGAGFAVLAKYDPVFKEVLYRNVMLMKRCTGDDGLLYGGLMVGEAGEPACIHHSICHAKMLAALVRREGDIEPEKRLLLPLDTAAGVLKYPLLDTYRLCGDGWLATISGYDYKYQPDARSTGGCISLLWNKKAGPVMASSMPVYRQIEANNMQLPAYFADIDITPRFEKTVERNRYTSSRDFTASEEIIGDTRVRVKGFLRNTDQHPLGVFGLEYDLEQGKFRIKGTTDINGAVFCLPVIADQDCRITISDYRVVIENSVKQYGICITCSKRMAVMDNYENGRKIFNPVGGFTALPICIEDADAFDVCFEEKIMNEKMSGMENG